MAQAIHTWHRKPTQHKASQLYESFTHAIKVGCTLDEAMTFAGSYVERITMSCAHRQNHLTRTCATIRSGMRTMKQAHNHKVTFTNHLPLLRARLARTWLKPVGKALGIPGAPWQVIVDKLIDVGNDDKANDVRLLFDPEFVHAKPTDERPVSRSQITSTYPHQIRAYVAPLPTRSYMTPTGEPHAYLNITGATPHVILDTRKTDRAARAYVDRFAFDDTPYIAVAVAQYSEWSKLYHIYSVRVRGRQTDE